MQMKVFSLRPDQVSRGVIDWRSSQAGTPIVSLARRPHMIGRPRAAAATISASSHKLRQSARTNVSHYSQHKQRIAILTRSATYGHTTSR